MKPIPYSLIAGAALAGFVACASAQPAHPPPAGPPTICNAGICKIDITVNDCGASGGITVAPAYLGMPVASGPATIHWRIVTPGYVFEQNGIRFDPPSPNFQRLPGGPANEIRMLDKKTSTGNFYYFVEVRNCIPVDPFIQNF
jgi:hypothetical protein